MKPNTTWYANSQRIGILMMSVVSGHAKDEVFLIVRSHCDCLLRVIPGDIYLINFNFRDCLHSCFTRPTHVQTRNETCNKHPET